MTRQFLEADKFSNAPPTKFVPAKAWENLPNEQNRDERHRVKYGLDYFLDHFLDYFFGTILKGGAHR